MKQFCFGRGIAALLGLTLAAGPLVAQQAARVATTPAGACHVRLQGEPAANAQTLLAQRLGATADDELRLQRIDKDAVGGAHARYQQYHMGYPVFGAVPKAHMRGDQVVALSGEVVHGLPAPVVLLTEQAARARAIATSGAQRLMHDLPGADAHLQRTTGRAGATWAPAGELMYVPASLPANGKPYRLAWRFDIYSVEPLFRADVFVDAATGEYLWQNTRLHTADANGLGHTRFSGVQAIVCDSTGSFYRLRESGRAQGVETYDMQNQTDYNAAVDFMQLDSEWDTFPTPTKAAGLDAHWGAEMTYDYYMSMFGRDSYDDLGSKLISYVHYDNGYSNAFWNGAFMTYGDGGQNNNPFPGLDVVGHEFTHGVTEYTANLVYAYEPGALNESFSDIFGNAIERYARPGQASWNIGDDIGAFRSMADPNIHFNPDTYLGTFWNSGGSDNGGVHTNSGVQNYWFYLISQGGSGTNDNGDIYHVTGMGIDTAARIAYHNLSTYLASNHGYAEARYFGIQSAIDLYGECSNAMIQVMNAWHAVGVGNPYTGTLEARFYTPDSNRCTVPADVSFQNRSLSGLNFFWDFGDGGTSTDENPTHTYMNAGTYTVTLIAFGCNGTADTLVFPNRVILDPQAPCNVNMPSNGDTLTLSACEGSIYDSGGNLDYLPSSFSRITIDPAGNQQVQLVFSAFNYASGDRVTIFDGPSTSSPQLGIFAGTAIPGPFVSTNGSLTIVESTNGSNNREGFVATWSCVTATDGALEQNCQLFPNPTDGLLHLRWTGLGMDAHTLAVYDALGRVVALQSGSHDGIWEDELDLSSLPAGVYTVHLEAGASKVAKKIFVQ